MDWSEGSAGGRRAIFGIVLIVGGIALAFGKLGWLRGIDFEHWWPVLLMAWGLGRLVLPRWPRDIGNGVSILAFGVWLQAVMLEWHHLTFYNSWPLAFVCSGLGMVARAIAEALYPRPQGDKKAGCC